MHPAGEDQEAKRAVQVRFVWFRTKLSEQKKNLSREGFMSAPGFRKSSPCLLGPCAWTESQSSRCVSWKGAAHIMADQWKGRHRKRPEQETQSEDTPLHTTSSQVSLLPTFHGLWVWLYYGSIRKLINWLLEKVSWSVSGNAFTDTPRYRLC